jgi:hypothetical protein
VTVAVLVLLGLLIVAALLILSGPADVESEADPVVAHEDLLGPMVARGLIDLNTFLERQSAFAAYLRQRDVSSGSKPE